MRTAYVKKDADRQPDNSTEAALRELELIAAEWVLRQRKRLSMAD